MADRYDRQRDYRDSRRAGADRDYQEGSYSRPNRSRSGSSHDQYQSTGRDTARRSERAPRGGGYLRDYGRSDSYGTSSERRYQGQRSSQRSYDASSRPRQGGRSAYGRRIEYDNPPSRQYGIPGERQERRPQYADQRQRSDGRRRDAAQQGRQQNRGSGRRADAFDPVSNLQGGRNMRGGGSRVQPNRSFDIADAFQMGKYIAIGIVALLIILFIGRMIYMSTPATYQVAGQEVSLARGTTYQGLLDSGALEASAGNLLAVDDEVLQEGGGKPPTVFLNGEPVNLGDTISDQGDITAENGEDEVEPYSTSNQEITPIETQIARDKQAEAEGAEAGTFNFYNGVLHVVTDPGQEGIVETRTGETSGKTATVKVQDMKPRVFENLYPTLPESRKLVALTFDDGPVPGESNTEGVLEVLAKYDVKATFFMIGTEVEQSPELTRKASDAGHQVASHLYSHDEKHFLNATTEEDAKYQVAHAREVIGQATGVEPTYVRPTGGNVNVKAIKAAGESADGYIGWTLDTFDYNLPGVDTIVKTVVDGVEPGSIILMHDGGGDRSQTVAALDKMIPQLQEKGYTFVTCEEMTKAVLEEREGGSSNAGASSSSSASSEEAEASAE